MANGAWLKEFVRTEVRHLTTMNAGDRLWQMPLAARIIGTVLGLVLALGLLKLPMDKWSISIAIMALTLAIEFTVVRHYALATIFITPRSFSPKRRRSCTRRAGR